MSKRIVKGYWSCTYCGTKHIDGLVDNCPNCAAKKPKDTKYYMLEGHVEYVTPDELKKAGISEEECDGNHEDWVCNYCDTLNNFSDTACSSCGAPRSEASHEYGMKEIDTASKNLFKKFDEFESSPDQLDTLKELVDFLPNEPKEETDEEEFTVREDPISTQKDRENVKAIQYQLLSHTSKKSLSKFKKLFIRLGIAAFIIASAIGIYQLFKPYEVTTEVIDYKWISSVTVEEERTVKESGWTVPFGGRVYDEKLEISGYQSVIDHYETKTVQRSREVLSHYETHTSYTDNGNGTFTENTYQTPVYKTEYYTETYEEPVYRQDPVYSTKYYYEIDKWFVDNVYKESEHDKSPYYSDDYTLKSKQRDTEKSTSYYVYYDNDMENTVSWDEYLETDIGDIVILKTCKLGIIYKSTEIDVKEGK